MYHPSRYLQSLPYYFSRRARQEYAAFQQLLSIVPNLLARLIESPEEEWASIARFVGDSV